MAITQHAAIEAIRVIPYNSDEAHLRFIDTFQDAQHPLPDLENRLWYGPMMKDRQATQLTQYLFFCKRIHRMNQSSDEDVRKVAFPTDARKLVKMFELFIMHVYREFRSRISFVQLTAGPIMYRLLTSRRDSLLINMDQYFNQQAASPPNRRFIHEAVTEAIHYVQSQDTDQNVNFTPEITALEEFRHVLDREMLNASRGEESEQHQLAWCIGRIATVCAESLGPSSVASSFMSWGDVLIQREAEAGKFTVSLRLVTATQQLASGEIRRKQQWFQINTPSADSLIFSVPHRILAIALRRNLLDGVDSLETLLSSDMHEVKIKSQHLKDPIFLEVDTEGNSLNPVQPLTADAMNRYLSSRANFIVTNNNNMDFMTNRRRSAPDLVDHVGFEPTREIMSHPIEIRTLEHYFLLQTFTRRAGSVAPEEDPDLNESSNMSAVYDALGHVPETRKAWANPHREATPVDPEPGELSHTPAESTKSASPPSEALIQKAKSCALNALVIRLMAFDRDFPVNAETNVLTQYKKHVWVIARDALHALEQQSITMTMRPEDLNRNAHVVSASNFAKAVVNTAVDTLRDRVFSYDASTGNDDGGTDGEEEYGMNSEVEVPVINTSAQKLQVQVDEVSFGPSLFDGVSYLQLSRSFLDIVSGRATIAAKPKTSTKTSLEHRRSASGASSASELEFGTADSPGDQSDSPHSAASSNEADPPTSEELICPKCIADPTISEEQKAKVYRYQSALDQHISSRMHAKFEKLKRQWTLEHEKSHPGGRWACPYCDPSRDFKDFNSLRYHVLHSTAAKNGTRHDRMKTDDGWYEPDFINVVSASGQKSRAIKADRVLKDQGLRYRGVRQISETSDAQIDGKTLPDFVQRFGDHRGGPLIVPDSAASGVEIFQNPQASITETQPGAARTFESNPDLQRRGSTSSSTGRGRRQQSRAKRAKRG